MKRLYFVIGSMLLVTLTFAAALPKHSVYLGLCTEDEYHEITQSNESCLYDYLLILYPQHNNATIWNSRRMKQDFLDDLAALPALGLDTTGYRLSYLKKLMASDKLEDQVKLEFSLTEVFINYYTQEKRGVVLKAQRHAKFKYPELYVDTMTALIHLMRDRDIDKIPKKGNFQIDVLRDRAISLYQAIPVSDSLDKLGLYDTVLLGRKNEAVALIREVLIATNDLKQFHKSKSTIFDRTVQAALVNFQYRHNIDSTGILDDVTIAKMHISVKEEWREILLNLERWRWLPRDLGEYYVLSNIPSYDLQVYEGDSITNSKKTVVGRKTRETPCFYSEMQYLDLNPTWTVPPTILAKDIVPKASANNSYLGKKNIVAYDRSTGKSVTSSDVDWTNASSYRFVQSPGGSNSLGKVKFIFPNNYYIFIHDTPTKSHFAKKDRAYSSGCLRVEHPEALTKFFLKDMDDYSEGKIDTLFQIGKTKRILLEKRPMVYVNYFTTTVDEQNNILFHEDIYKYNEGLAKELFN